MKFFFILTCISFFASFFTSCSSISLKKIKVEGAKNIELSIISGSLNVERYKTVSRIKVFAIDKNNKKKLTENKLELSTFDLNREAFAVSPDGKAQFKYWVTNLQGDVDLTNMGLPPEGKTLLEAIDKKAKVLAVQGFPESTIFYLPKISLPNKEVKPGDVWTYTGQWRSLKTGWPFQVDLDLKLESWVSCGGLMCAHITYAGRISLPKGNPLKKARLNSTVKGEFVYAPVGHQFIWSYADSVESFISSSKEVSVKSCTASYQTSPDKESLVFAKKIKKTCN